jgi:carboxymethylenebutenolidase
MLGIYAGRDELIPESDRRQLADKLEQDKKSFQIKVYEQAEHAFFNDRRPHFHKEAAQDAWQRTLDFIKEHSNCPSEP